MTEVGLDAPSEEGPLAIICAGGSLPFAVADLVERRGRRAVLFALRGWVDPNRIASYRHHWIAIGQLGRFRRLARQEGCRELVFIGSFIRPTLRQIRLDLDTLRVLPKVIASFRGGDDHLLKGVAKIVEDYGFRFIGPHEVAPEILVPEGALGHGHPSERDQTDIAHGLALLQATGGFDVGQAVIVAGKHVLAVEAAEGTDSMLERIAVLRRHGRISLRDKVGVLVKAPKQGQDRRFDLPSIGPQTIEGVARAGLAGVAAVAGGTIIAEPDRVAQAADRARLFVVGVPALSGDRL